VLYASRTARWTGCHLCVGVARIGALGDDGSASFFDTLIIVATRFLCHGIIRYHSSTRPSSW